MKPLNDYTQDEFEDFHNEAQFAGVGNTIEGYVIVKDELSSAEEWVAVYEIVVHDPETDRYFAYNYKVRHVDMGYNHEFVPEVQWVREVTPREVTTITYDPIKKSRR